MRRLYHVGMPASRHETDLARRRRSREAVLTAAAELISAGRTPTVGEAAEAAHVSRATAYRHFPSQDLLLTAAAMHATIYGLDGVDEDITRICARTPDHATRVARVVRRVAEMCYDNQHHLRLVLHLIVNDPQFHRPGHRLKWIELALDPLRPDVDADTHHRLGNALVPLMGIDPILALVDVARHTRAQVLDTLEWTAYTLVAGALRQPS